jgi:hypothetical protein
LAAANPTKVSMPPYSASDKGLTVSIYSNPAPSPYVVRARALACDLKPMLTLAAGPGPPPLHRMSIELACYCGALMVPAWLVVNCISFAHGNINFCMLMRDPHEV